MQEIYTTLTISYLHVKIFFFSLISFVSLVNWGKLKAEIISVYKLRLQNLSLLLYFCAINTNTLFGKSNSNYFIK